MAFSSLSNSGELNYASKLFSHTPEPTSFMWNTLIRAHAAGPNPRQPLSLYIEMRRNCVTPGKYTFPFLLKACSNFSSLISCRQVHAHVFKIGLELDLHVVNGLIRGYSVSGGLRDAREVFVQVSERDLTIWTTMVSVYAQNDYGSEAIELFNQMISRGYAQNDCVLASP